MGGQQALSTTHSNHESTDLIPKDIMDDFGGFYEKSRSEQVWIEFYSTGNMDSYRPTTLSGHQMKSVLPKPYENWCVKWATPSRCVSHRISGRPSNDPELEWYDQMETMENLREHQNHFNSI
jgi:hypothetical protein